MEIFKTVLLYFSSLPPSGLPHLGLSQSGLPQSGLPQSGQSPRVWLSKRFCPKEWRGVGWGPGLSGSGDRLAQRLPKIYDLPQHGFSLQCGIPSQEHSFRSSYSHLSRMDIKGILDKMGAHFTLNCKDFDQKLPFYRIPIFSRTQNFAKEAKWSPFSVFLWGV